VLHVRDCFLEQLSHVIVVQRVDDVASFTSAVDQAEVAKQAKLVRDRRALHPHIDSKLRDGARAVLQPAENPQPAGCRECLHRVCDDLGEAVVQLMRSALNVSVAHLRDDS